MSRSKEFQYREIPGYPGYRIRSDGTVWSFRKKGVRDATNNWSKKLSLYRRPYGNHYVVVCMRAVPGGKVTCHYIHRLMLECFVGPCPEGMEACHNDGDSANNRLDNLRWDTKRGNEDDKLTHGTIPRGSDQHQAVFTEGLVAAMRVLGQTGLTATEIAGMFDTNPCQVAAILRGEKWAHVDDLYILNLLGKRPC